MNKNHIMYRAIEPSEVDHVVDGLTLSFAYGEPMGQVLGLNPGDILELFARVVRDSLQYSLLAFDKEKNEIAGAIICNDFMYFMQDKQEDIEVNIKIKPIIEMLSLLEGSFKNSQNYNTSTPILYQYATYVQSKYRGNGIASQLYKASEKMALLGGFNQIVTISTGIVSQHIRSNKLNFREQRRVNYNTFLFDGDNVFAGIEPTSCILFAKDIL